MLIEELILNKIENLKQIGKGIGVQMIMITDGTQTGISFASTTVSNENIISEENMASLEDTTARML